MKILFNQIEPKKLDNLKVGDLISNGAYNELRIINPAIFRILERQEDGNWKYVGSNETNIVELFRYSDLIHLPLEMYWIQLDDSQMDIYEKQEYVFKAPNKITSSPANGLSSNKLKYVPSIPVAP